MDQGPDWFCGDAYQASVAKIRALSSGLPPEALVPLAEEVIARLAANATPSPAAGPSDAWLDAFCRALLSSDDEAGAQFILELRDHGASIESVCLGHLAAAARRLGAWWQRDEATFLDVTLGTGRIYAILRAMRPARPQPPIDRKRALFSSAPGETHTLGVAMAADLFRARGWEVDLKVGLQHQELVDAIAAAEASIVGLSAGGAHAAPALAKLIVAVRIVRPDAYVLVSGAIVSKTRPLLSALGADDLAEGFADALAASERRWRMGLADDRRTV